jgi:hypothetical protein
MRRGRGLVPRAEACKFDNRGFALMSSGKQSVEDGGTLALNQSTAARCHRSRDRQSVCRRLRAPAIGPALEGSFFVHGGQATMNSSLSMAVSYAVRQPGQISCASLMRMRPRSPRRFTASVFRNTASCLSNEFGG